MSFADEVYEQLKKVPIGKVTTYKALATKLGSRAYRAVGQIMRNNPYAPTVACHRVVRSDGRIGGFRGEIDGEEIQNKIAMLRAEGVSVVGGKVDLNKFGV